MITQLRISGHRYLTRALHQNRIACSAGKGAAGNRQVTVLHSYAGLAAGNHSATYRCRGAVCYHHPVRALAVNSAAGNRQAATINRYPIRADAPNRAVVNDIDEDTGKPCVCSNSAIISIDRAPINIDRTAVCDNGNGCPPPFCLLHVPAM